MKPFISLCGCRIELWHDPLGPALVWGIWYAAESRFIRLAVKQL